MIKVRRLLGLTLLGACLGARVIGGVAWAQAGDVVHEDRAMRRPAAAPDSESEVAERSKGTVRLLPEELPDDPLADLPGPAPVAPGYGVGEGLDDTADPLGGPLWEAPLEGRTPGLLGDGNSDSVLDTPLESDVDDETAEQAAPAGRPDQPREPTIGDDALDSGGNPFEEDGRQFGSEYRDPVEW